VTNRPPTNWCLPPFKLIDHPPNQLSLRNQHAKLGGDSVTLAIGRLGRLARRGEILILREKQAWQLSQLVTSRSLLSCLAAMIGLAAIGLASPSLAADSEPSETDGAVAVVTATDPSDEDETDSSDDKDAAPAKGLARWDNVAQNDGIPLAIAGMTIVFLALAMISGFIAQLPNLLKLLNLYVDESHIGVPGASAAATAAKIAAVARSEEKVVAAIAMALHQEQTK